MEKPTTVPESEENYEDNSEFELDADEETEQLQRITFRVLSRVFKSIMEQEILDLNGSDL